MQIWKWQMRNTLWQDLRYSLRRLRWSPGFTTVAVLSVALGIGANTAIFSLVYTLMLRMLPVREPGQLVELLHRYPGEPHLNGASWSAYQLMLHQNHVLSGLTAAVYQPLLVRGKGLETQTVDGGYVDGTFFPVLGIKPAVGRLITPEDDHFGDHSAVAVLSWSYWKSRFNLDPAILGRRIVVNDVPVTVVGVTPRNFHGLQVEAHQDVWLPLTMEPTALRSGHPRSSLWLVGRLKPGVSIQAAHAELAVLYESTLEEDARTGRRRPTLQVGGSHYRAEIHCKQPRSLRTQTTPQSFCWQPIDQNTGKIHDSHEQQRKSSAARINIGCLLYSVRRTARAP